MLHCRAQCEQAFTRSDTIPVTVTVPVKIEHYANGSILPVVKPTVTVDIILNFDGDSVGTCK